MKTMDLGKVSIIPRGLYTAETTYHQLDIVQYNGSSFLVKQDVTGVVPEEGEYYTLLAQKGDTGQAGKDGEKGDPGDRGLTGPAGKDGIGKKRTVRFVVGTSTAGWTSDDVDYLCDGTNDDVEIQAAINALPDTGGDVLLLNGTYNISSTIIISTDYTTLCGINKAVNFKGSNLGDEVPHPQCLGEWCYYRYY